MIKKVGYETFTVFPLIIRPKTWNNIKIIEKLCGKHQNAGHKSFIIAIPLVFTWPEKNRSARLEMQLFAVFFAEIGANWYSVTKYYKLKQIITFKY